MPNWSSKPSAVVRRGRHRHHPGVVDQQVDRRTRREQRRRERGDRVERRQVELGDPDVAGQPGGRGPAALGRADRHEHGDGVPEALLAANLGKIEAIAAAQRDGRVSDRFPADDLMVMITGLAILGSPFLAMTQDLEQRRHSVIEAVRLLTQGDAR